MTSENCDVDAELLISFIEERPVRWDRTLETYRDKNFTLEAWREICKIVHPDFESLDERKRKEYNGVLRESKRNAEIQIIR
jgi:hypothetical protein